ncbi:MAG: tetratricopeptide repeat protein [Limisphaerales bacterium]
MKIVSLDAFAINKRQAIKATLAAADRVTATGIILIACTVLVRWPPGALANDGPPATPLTPQPMLSITSNAATTLPKIMEALKEANEMWLKGDATNGIPTYERLLGQIEAAFGKDSSMAGLVVFRIGFLHATHGDFEKALPYLERSLKLVGPLPDNEQNLLTKANLYWGLGMSYKSLLNHEEAIQAFNHFLTLKEKLVSAEDPSLAEILITVANLHSTQQRHLDAIPLLERALAITEKTFGAESAEAATVLASLGNTRDQAGQVEVAIACLKRSLAIREKILQPTSPEVAIALHNLGSVYARHGDYQQAMPLLERSVELLEKIYRPNDAQSTFQLAGALNNLGTAELEGGNYDKGIAALQRSLAIAESAFGSASVNLASTLNSIAVACRGHGDFDRAQRFYERALRILEGAPAYKSRERVDTLNNLAQMLLDMGDEDAAFELFSQGMELAESQVGTNALPVAFSLNGLALINQRRANIPEALTLFERSLAILQNTLGPSHRDVAGVLNNISVLLEITGDTNGALRTLQRAFAIQEKVLPPVHPHIAATLNNLAAFSIRRGDLVEARNLFRKSVTITDAAMGRNNPDSCARLESLGIVEFLSGDASRGLSEFVESTRRWRRYLASQTIFQQGPSASRIQEKVQSSRDWFQSLCGVAPSRFSQAASFSGAEQLAFGKGVLEEVETVRARLTADGRVQVQALREQADSTRTRLEAIAYPEGTAWLRERMDWRNSERDRLEHNLKGIEERIAAANELVALTIREGDLSLAEIARSLPSSAVLVDLVQYRRTDFTAADNQWKEQHYAAYLTFPLTNAATNVVVERVDLGEAAPIDDAVASVIKRFSATPAQYLARDLPAALQKLTHLAYEPLARHLTNVSHLIICPDGQLSRLPFELLPVGEKFLIEEKTVSYVTSGREIVRLAANHTDSKPKSHSSKSIVMGNPDFDFDLPGGNRSDALTQESGNGARNPEFEVALLGSKATKALSRDYRGLEFLPLPGAEAEARSVAKLIGNDCILRLGADAREAELKAAVSPRVLHLATHGFFLSDQEFMETNTFGEYGQPRRLHHFKVGHDWENPLLRCGIALAGANHAMQITNALAEDGLLTGLEASLLNLQGTELVILSACDSGTGEVKIGEGVMSLRRAFRIAGAETVLASHWSINDKATSQLMTEFMRRWQAGEPRAKAWREAQLQLLRSKDFSDPYFWAAFTLTGQWR